ncbi:toll-like receptor 4 [Mytilus edulis]|uniref:toll-like receptor 4 n=1 Tax=Mytilus edulis TaxID=6550 RepID=UPI0039F0117F
MEHALLCNFILMLFVLCSYFLYAKGIAYPCKENLKRGKLHVDCSNKGLLNLIFSGIPQVPSNAFSLNLQHNSIHIIRNKDLRHMTNLTVLDLSYNRLSYISGDAFNGLEKLQQLRLNNNELDYRHYETTRSFQPLKSLKLLSIENNAHLSYFPEEALAYLTKLEIFKVDLPKSSSISMSLNLGKEYRKLTNLYSLYLNGEGNEYLYLTMHCFQYTPNLTHLYIFHFQSVIIQNFTISKLNNLKLLQIDYHNHRPQFGEESFEYQKFGFNWIHELYFSPTEILKIRNFVPDDYKRELFLYCVWDILNKCLSRSFRQLHLTNILGLNKMCVPTQSVFHAPPSLQILNLRRNNLTWISLNISSVVTLDLKHNRLRHYLENNSYLITQTSKLENIYLAHNQIYQLNTEIFKGQPYLKHIDLSFNILSNISFDPSHLENLQILNLTNNKIKFFNEIFMKKIDILLKKNNKTKIDLCNNPLLCKCYTVSSLKWMLQIRQHFIKFSQYQCTYENGTRSKANSFEKVITYLVQECLLKPNTKHTSNLTLSVSMTVFGIITAMIFSSALVIYKRWKLRYLYYTAKMKYTSIENGDEDSREYDYDAFISYSDEDRMFVINDCIKNLELDRNLKLCIHERDFIPGHDITNNIVRAIQTSRKTICIITRSFLKSDFCMFELNMAKMESTHSRNGKNILVLVFNEKLSSKDLPLHLYEHIQKQSYIQYQNNEIVNAFFWEKINDAIYA